MENIESISEAIRNLQSVMDAEGIDPRLGLPEDLFLFASTLTPLANVDLFIHDKKGNVLLAWRDNEFDGKGWHIPGGCIRIKKTCEERIQKTALNEIGCEVICKSEPIMVKEPIVHWLRPQLENELMRSHNISVLYECRLPDDFTVDNHGKCEHDAGYLKWFDMVPKDLLQCHKELYGELLGNWFRRNIICKRFW